jgi:DNA invertase Pin-like site-specific DNA recombinase
VIQVRGYLRASTKDQDAERARGSLRKFAKQHELQVAAFYVENESGTKLKRPELFRLLDDSEPGDIILLEQIDRLSRLNESDWKKLRAEIERRQIRVVSIDVPTSWVLASSNADDFTARMFSAINNLMLDMLAAIARKDWEDRRRRQAEGIAKRKSGNGYAGRPENIERNNAIAKLLAAGLTWSQVMATTKTSRATVAKVAGRIRTAA